MSLQNRSTRSILLAIALLFLPLSLFAQLESKGIEDVMKYSLYEPEPQPIPELPSPIMMYLGGDVGVSTLMRASENRSNLVLMSYGLHANLLLNGYSALEVGYSTFDDSYASSRYGAEQWELMKQGITMNNISASYMLNLSNYTYERIVESPWSVSALAGLDFGFGENTAAVGGHGALRVNYKLGRAPFSVYAEPRIGFSRLSMSGGGASYITSTSLKFGLEMAITGENCVPYHVANFCAMSGTYLYKLLYDATVSVGVQAVCESQNMSSTVAMMTRLGLGAKISKYSGVEFGIAKFDDGPFYIPRGEGEYLAYSPEMGFDVSYRFNLLNAIHGNEDYRLFGVSFLAGADYRWGDNITAPGGHLGARLSLHPGTKVSLYAEPRLTILKSEDLAPLRTGFQVSQGVLSLSIGAAYSFNSQMTKEERISYRNEYRQIKADVLSSIPVAYIAGAFGAETMLKSTYGLIGSMSASATGTLGLFLTKHSAVEGQLSLHRFDFAKNLHTDPTWEEKYSNWLPKYGVNISYRHDLLNYLFKQELPIIGISALAGIDYRDGAAVGVFGYHVGLRGLINVSPTISLYAEPRLTVFNNEVLSRLSKGVDQQNMMSANFGMEIYFNRKGNK